MRRTGTSFLQFRQRIPFDVLDKARGKSIALPIGTEVIHRNIGSKAVEITASLQTRDLKEAKKRQVQVLTYLDAYWNSLRSDITRLTHKQILGLAGEAYKALIATFEDDPGKTETWAALVKINAGLLTEGHLALERWFGSSVDQILAKHHLQVDADSRSTLLTEVSLALTKATVRVAQNASGDYSPDPIAPLFPEFKKPHDAHVRTLHSATSGQTITGLVQGWWREAKAAGRSISTYEAYERAARLLSNFLKHDDASAVTFDDIIRFKDYRLASGTSIKTITASDISAFRQLFQWGIDNNKLNISNPAEGVKVAKIKKARTRSTGFTDEEAKLILSHASNHKQGRENPRLFNARRWVPWLCAYTGARLGEIVQLRKQDIRNEDDLWIITITPEAGTVKDGEYREVPLHPHLIDLRFPKFVQQCKSGYLFMNPLDMTEDAVRKALRTSKNRITDFVREVLTDTSVQPNHAWRHRFMTVGRDLQIPRDIRFAITGHASKDEGDDYGEVSILAKAGAINQYPRFDID